MKNVAKAALVHYWFTTWRGGESVVKAISELYPGIEVFAHVADAELVAREMPGLAVRTSFIGKLPFSRKHYQKYLPLMPMALEALDLREYDLVICSESGPAKGVITRPDALNITYCHSPMRYAWDMYHEYRDSASILTRALMGPTMHYMRSWDQLSAQRVDHFIANSQFVASRIKKYYRRDSVVIYPPVDVQLFAQSETQEDFFLWVGQLVPYKRPDLVVDCFNELGFPLRVIGEGPLLKSMKARARSNITFLGRQSTEVIRYHYARCRALVFPGVEDFGIVPVEAMASGRPVIAYAAGGAMETVVPGVSGILFEEQTVAGLKEGLRAFERMETQFVPERLITQAAKFSKERFLRSFAELVAEYMERRAVQR